MTLHEPAPVTVLEPPRSAAAAAVAAMRPRQWTKNLLLFAGIIFAAELGDAERWAAAVAAFLGWCAASSAAYLVNDVHDAEIDRAHPVKRRRPIARGELSLRAALALAGALLLVSVALVAPLGLPTLGFLAGFVVLQAAYTLGLKDVVLIDVFAIGALFVIRAAAGATAVDVEISPWLLLCTALLALFLALGKRRAELVASGGAGRSVLEGYSPALVDQLIAVVAASTVIAYSLYTFTARESQALMITIPFVLFGVFRYLLVLQRGARAEEPENVLLRDTPILACVAAWVVTCAAVLAAIE